MKITYLIVASVLLIGCQSAEEKKQEKLRLDEKMKFYEIASATFSPYDEDSLMSLYDSIAKIGDAEVREFAKVTSAKINHVSDSIYEVNHAKLIEEKKQELAAEEKFKKSKAGRIKAKHPDWSKEDCINLANHKIWIGMTYEMLLELRGKPNHVNTSNYGRGNEYQACWDDYDPGCFYFGEDHIIDSYN